MLLATLICAYTLQAPSAKEFMPLATGTKWTYRETGEDTLVFLYTAESSKVFQGQEAVPIVVRYKGNPLSTTYYIVDDQGASIVSEDGSAAYTPRRPLFKVGEGPQNWSYSGTVPFDSSSAPLTLTGSSRMIDKRKVLGEDVEALEVTIDATVTPAKGQKLVQHQVAVYGKGIGLVEMTMTATLKGQEHRQHLELIKLQRPGALKG